jgi:hypothetical protein
MKPVRFILIFLVSALMVSGFSRVHAQMEALDSNGDFVGTLMKYSEDSTTLYNMYENILFSIKGDGTLATKGPEQVNSRIIYYDGQNCSGKPYIIPSNLFNTGFTEACHPSVKLAAGELFITSTDFCYSAVSKPMVFQSYRVHGEKEGCLTCVPLRKTVTSGRYCDILKKKVSFYPVKVPVQMIDSSYMGALTEEKARTVVKEELDKLLPEIKTIVSTEILKNWADYLRKNSR